MRFARFATPGEPQGPPGPPDALVLPAEAGLAVLGRRGVGAGPAAYDPAGRRVHLLVPGGSAEELPGLLEWLEWGGIELGLGSRSPYDPREAAVWLRPPESGPDVRRVDLTRLVSAAATECHRARLRRTAGAARSPRRLQPLAFS